MTHFFTYGTLAIPESMEAISGRALASAEACKTFHREVRDVPRAVPPLEEISTIDLTKFKLILILFLERLYMMKTGLTTKGLIDRLEAAGVQPTAQRIAIFQYVTREGDHPTAEAVKAWMDDHFPKMSLATVYNTLRILVKAKLVREFKLPHIDKVVYDSNVKEHHHFLDEGTGTLIDLDPDTIKLKPKLKRTYRITETHVLLKGTRRST